MKKIKKQLEGEKQNYSDEDVKKLETEYNRIYDEMNVKKITIRNLASDLDKYKKNRTQSFDLVKERLLQELERNKKDYYRLKQERELHSNQIKFMKLFIEEEKKRTKIKLKQQEEYLNYENEKKIQKLLQIQREMEELVQKNKSNNLEKSIELFDQETSKKLNKIRKQIELNKNKSKDLKINKDEYYEENIPIYTTTTKRTLKKKEKKKKTEKRNNKRKNKRKTSKKTDKSKKKSLKKSLKKLIGLD
jgi:hypothetical protein